MNGFHEGGYVDDEHGHSAHRGRSFLDDLRRQMQEDRRREAKKKFVSNYTRCIMVHAVTVWGKMFTSYTIFTN